MNFRGRLNFLGWLNFLNWLNFRGRMNFLSGRLNFISQLNFLSRLNFLSQPNFLGRLASIKGSLPSSVQRSLELLLILPSRRCHNKRLQLLMAVGSPRLDAPPFGLQPQVRQGQVEGVFGQFTGTLLSGQLALASVSEMALAFKKVPSTVV